MKLKRTYLAATLFAFAENCAVCSMRVKPELCVWIVGRVELLELTQQPS